MGVSWGISTPRHLNVLSFILVMIIFLALVYFLVPGVIDHFRGKDR
jgi:hypothetical protein